MLVARWSGSVFVKSIFRAGFGEIGDKTFYLAIVLLLAEPLKSWFQKYSIAGGYNERLLCVVLGTFVALLTRDIMMSFNIQVENWASGFHFISFGMLTFLTVDTIMQMYKERNAESDYLAGKAEGDSASSNPFAAGESYASTAAPSARSDASPEKPADPSTVSRITGWFVLIFGSKNFLIPYLLVFFVDVDDKSSEELLEFTHNGFDFFFGVAIGQFAAVMLVVGVAYLIQAVFGAQQMAVINVLGLAAISLTCLSQAILTLNWSKPMRIQPGQSFLSYHARTVVAPF